MGGTGGEMDQKKRENCRFYICIKRRHRERGLGKGRRKGKETCRQTEVDGEKNSRKMEVDGERKKSRKVKTR